MQKKQVEIGGLYEVKLSTGRLARMRVVKFVPATRGRHGKFLVTDIDKKLEKYVGSAKLRKRISELSVVQEREREQNLEALMHQFLTQYKGCKGHAGTCHGMPCEEKFQAFLNFRKEKGHVS